MESKAGFERRDFIKGALAGAAAAVLPFGLVGCDSGDASAASKLASAMKEEERAASIADSTYMGGKIDYYGRELVMSEGPAGQIVPQTVIDYITSGPKEVVEQADKEGNVFVSHAFPLTNIVAYRGKTGMVILDSAESIEQAAPALESFKEKLGDLPVSAIIYSHDHYAYGSQAYIPADNPNKIPIIAHDKIMSDIADGIGPLSPTWGLRGARQFGMMLPSEGPDAPVAGSVGGLGEVTIGFIEPNTFVPGDVPCTELEVDGLTFRFFPGKADSQCNLSVYCVDYDVLYSSFVMPCWFNMYTLRGQVYRDPLPFIDHIDLIRKEGAGNFIAQMGPLFHGKDVTELCLSQYRDSIQLVWDQTVRHMNRGLDPDGIVEAVEIPTSVTQGLLTAPVYGEVEHFLRGMYSGMIGWFGNDCTELHPVTKSFEYGRLVEALGGDDAVVAAAQVALDDRQYAWAAKIATYVLTNNPDHVEARKVKGEALRQMGRTTSSTIVRAFMMTQAYELEGAELPDATWGAYALTTDKLMVSPRTTGLDIVRVTIDPVKADGVKEGITFNFTDFDESYTLAIRNCVAAVEEGKTAYSTVEVDVAYADFSRILVGETTLAELKSEGKVVVGGDQEILDKVLSLFDMDL